MLLLYIINPSSVKKIELFKTNKFKNTMWGRKANSRLREGTWLADMENTITTKNNNTMNTKNLYL